MLERASFATERAKEFLVNTGSVLSRAQSLVSGDSQIFSVVPRSNDLRQALNSSSVYDKLYGMKVITAQVCKGSDMRSFFPDVVKNIHEPSMELRKLIYMFVVHYAHICPNEALLSISAFQKDLMDASMHVRALALRMLSSINIPAIHPVVMVAVRKCAKDQASVVRKSAAIALLQAHCICKNNVQRDSLYEILRDLLADQNTDVMGTAVMVFNKIARDRDDLLHPFFRKICKELPHCEEWAQDAILRVLLRYARRQFQDPNLAQDVEAAATASSSSSSSSSSSLGLGFHGRAAAAAPSRMSPDHELLLRSVKPLLTSLNSAVVVSVCAILLHCGPVSAVEDCVRPLVRVYRHATGGRGVLLRVLHTVAQRHPAGLVPHLGEFFLLPMDGPGVREGKHRLLACLVGPASVTAVAAEYAAYLRGADPTGVAAAVRGLGVLAAAHPALAPRVLPLLRPLLLRREGAPPALKGGGARRATTPTTSITSITSTSTSTSTTVAAAVAVLRVLVGQEKGGVRARVVFRLLRDAMAGRLASALALATVLWLVGENIRSDVAVAAAAPDCFRAFVQSFPSLAPVVKEEVLRLGCKVWLHLDGNGEVAERFKRIFMFALELARYDDYYAIRDHARMYECVLERDSDAFKALKDTLLGEKSVPKVSDPHATSSGYELGTFSHLWGHPVMGYEELPAWRTEPPDDALRIPPGEAILESELGQRADLKSYSSHSMGLHDDSSGTEDNDDGSDTSETSSSTTGSTESGTEASEASGDTESDSLASSSRRRGSGARAIPSSNGAMAAQKIVVTFKKHDNAKGTPLAWESPIEAAPPISSAQPTPSDTPSQTGPERTDILCDNGAQSSGLN